MVVETEDENSSQESYLVRQNVVRVQLFITFIQNVLHASKYTYTENKDRRIQPCYQLFALLLHCWVVKVKYTMRKF